ncbi:amidohydrolase family protein [Halioxenophilus sp. WMMB6]|uniref:Xaa-Pro dipeptidase n=1 Tax=Halioxenophilus sp. WMMB6 TaxID=3073815 RepID=UPI00295E496C|nr:amidohydrolase family protein [Halioxenophilus sp. WMMB6]
MIRLFNRFTLACITTLLAATSHATTWVKADALLDVVSGKLINNPIVEIDGDKFVAVHTSPPTPAEEDEWVDLSGMTLLPGLMDMHVHITGSHAEHGYRRLQATSGHAAILGTVNLNTTLQAGFTTIRNLGAPDYIDIDLAKAVDEGLIPGPRMFASGPSLGITGGHCDNNLLPKALNVPADGVADGPWAVRTKVRENIKYGAKVIKFCATGGVLSKGTKVGVQQYTLEEMQALVDEAHRRGLIVAAHAHGTEGIKAAIEAGVDSVEHASFLDAEAIKMAKKRGTYFSMDIYVTEFILSEGEAAGILPESLEKERQTGQRQRKSFSDAVAAGVKMVFGTDAAVYPHGDNAKQFARMVRFGMTELQAIQAATINAATLLKMQDQLGSVASGKQADLIAVAGNPLENISLLEQVGFVMKDGTIYKQPEQ